MRFATPELIFEAASYPKTFVTLDGADHLLRDPEQGQYAAEMLATWANRYIDRVQPVDEQAETDLEPETVLVEQSDEGLYVNRVVVGRHQFWADEPISIGVDDAGPSPYDLVSGALGACTSMTLRMYADHKKWPLEHVKVTLKHEKINAQSDASPKGKRPKKIDKFSRELTLRGDLNEAQRARLVEIADRCPVHRTLMQENVIETKRVDTQSES